MRGLWSIFTIVGALMFGTTSTALAGAEVGQPAPDFCLPSSQGDKVCLKDFKGKDKVVLLFYVLDFTDG